MRDTPPTDAACHRLRVAASRSTPRAPQPVAALCPVLSARHFACRDNTGGAAVRSQQQHHARVPSQPSTRTAACCACEQKEERPPPYSFQPPAVGLSRPRRGAMNSVCVGSSRPHARLPRPPLHGELHAPLHTVPFAAAPRWAGLSLRAVYNVRLVIATIITSPRRGRQNPPHTHERTTRPPDRERECHVTKAPIGSPAPQALYVRVQHELLCCEDGLCPTPQCASSARTPHTHHTQLGRSFRRKNNTLPIAHPKTTRKNFRSPQLRDTESGACLCPGGVELVVAAVLCVDPIPGRVPCRCDSIAVCDRNKNASRHANRKPQR